VTNDSVTFRIFQKTQVFQTKTRLEIDEMMSSAPNEEMFDITLIGGGISGSFLALNILRKWRTARIAIIERSVEFQQKPGESLSDMSGLILGRMDLDHILKKHPEKTGLRFFFNETNTGAFAESAEFSSPSLRSVTNGFHINRKLFDQQMLDEVAALGAIIFRPAEILEVTAKEFENVIQFSQENYNRQIRSRWIVDASGRARFMHRKMGWTDIPVQLKTSSIFAHFTGVLPRSEWNLPTSPYWNQNAIGADDFSTIHLMRPSAWWWFIRIDEVTTSVGIVFDHNALPYDEAEEFFNQRIREDGTLTFILSNAKRGPVQELKQLAYCSEKFYSKGIVLAGDSAAFVDPLVSPGIEMILQQSLWLADLLVADGSDGQFNEARWNRYEKIFRQAYLDRCTIYTLAYPLMHSYDLMKNWLRMALFSYFGLTVFLAVILPPLQKKPVVMNRAEGLALGYFNWRQVRIKNRRTREHRISVYQPGEMSFSTVYVSRGAKVFLIPLRMFLMWFSDYVALEWKEIRIRFGKKSKPDSQ